MGRPATDKRKRLTAAAVVQYHHKGIERTSLADVANAAGVPPGNSYYYFRSKDDLTRSVIDEWEIRIADYFAGLDLHPNAAARVSAYLDGVLERRSAYVANGCPLNALGQDARRKEITGVDGSRLYNLQLHWLRDQFHLLGLSDEKADGTARFFLSSIQGSLLLSHATDDPRYIDRTIEQLKDHFTGPVTNRSC